MPENKITVPAFNFDEPSYVIDEKMQRWVVHRLREKQNKLSDSEQVKIYDKLIAKVEKNGVNFYAMAPQKSTLRSIFLMMLVEDGTSDEKKVEYVLRQCTYEQVKELHEEGILAGTERFKDGVPSEDPSDPKGPKYSSTRFPVVDDFIRIVKWAKKNGRSIASLLPEMNEFGKILLNLVEQGKKIPTAAAAPHTRAPHTRAPIKIADEDDDDADNQLYA